MTGKGTDLGGNRVARAEASSPEHLLHVALLLLTPGKWGRERGYDVPTDAAWTAARIHLMRLAGRDDVAVHLYEDEMAMLTSLDWSAGNTARADALNEALAALTTPTALQRSAPKKAKRKTRKGAGSG